MKLNIPVVNTMRQPFRFRQPMKDFERLLLHPSRQSARRDRSIDSSKRERRAQPFMDRHIHFRGMDRASRHGMRFQSVA